MPGPAYTVQDGWNVHVVATIAVANSAAGATTAALTVQLRQANNSDLVTEARQFMIYGSTTRYDHFSALSATLTFINATTGSIIASGAGWALVETSSTGAFACTANNTADETVYFACDIPSAGVSDIAKAAQGLVSNSDAATWLPP